MNGPEQINRFWTHTKGGYEYDNQIYATRYVNAMNQGERHKNPPKFNSIHHDTNAIPQELKSSNRIYKKSMRKLRLKGWAYLTDTKSVTAPGYDRGITAENYLRRQLKKDVQIPGLRVVPLYIRKLSRVFSKFVSPEDDKS